MNLDGKTTPELLAIRQALEAKPENREPAGGLHLFNKATRRKLDAIDLQITFNLAEARKAAGRPVPCDGYSGRQSNR